MTPEERLRDAMEAYASQTHADPEAWAAIEARLERRPRRWPAGRVGGLAVAALGVAAAVTFALMAGGSDQTQVGTGPAATSDLPRPAPTVVQRIDPPVSLLPLPADAPASFVAVRDQGTELVVVDSATGEVLRTLVDLGPYEPPVDGVAGPGSAYIDGISLTPDGGSVYYSVGPEPVVGTIFRVATSGGDPQLVDNGAWPVVSPDGTRLAFSQGSSKIIVRELGAGRDSSFEDAGTDNTTILQQLTGWSTDGRYVLFEAMGVEGSSSAKLLDTSRPGGLREASRELAQPSETRGDGPGDGNSLWAPTARAIDGLVGVIEVCCPGPEGTGPQDGGQSFAVFDPVTGLVRGRISLPFTAADARYDPTGKHQLFVDNRGWVHRRSSGPEFATYPLTGVTLLDW